MTALSAFHLQLVRCIALCFTLHCTGAWRAGNIPNPVTSPEACGNREASWVCNPNHIISQAEATELNQLSVKIHGSPMKKCGGPVFAIVIINKVDRIGMYDSKEVKKNKLAAFGKALTQRTSWRAFGCRNLSVIIVSSNDNFIYTGISSNLNSPILTVDCVQNILDKNVKDRIKPWVFRQTKKALEAYGEALGGNGSVCWFFPDYIYYVVPAVFVALILLIAFCLCWFRCCGCCGDVRGKSTAICKCCLKNKDPDDNMEVPYVNM